MAKILLFSRAIRSGKTTELFRNLHRFKDVGGFLCPDNELDNREFFLIREKKYYPFQVPSALVGETLEIGRFHFLLRTFQRAREELLYCLQNKPEWLVVDEVGKLEIKQNKGLEPALTQVINHYKQAETKGNLLLVVRDYLVSEVIEHYQIKDYTLLDELDAWEIKI